MYPLSMCVVLTHNRCGVHIMRTQPSKELFLTAMLLGFFMPCSRLTATMDGGRTLVSAIIQPPLTFPEPLWIFHFTWLWWMDGGRIFQKPLPRNYQRLFFSSRWIRLISFLEKISYEEGCIGLSFPKGKGSFYLGKDAVLQQFISEVTSVFFDQIFMVLAFGASTAWNPNLLLLPGMLI